MAIINTKVSPNDPLGPSEPGGMDSLPINNICGTPVCDGDIEKPIVIVPTTYTLGKEYVGTSETDKPMNVQQYSIYHELDTGKNYYYDNGEWNEIPCCSGGGGDEYPIWHVTINSVAVPTYGLSFNSSVWEDENHNQYYKNFVESDGKWFYSYGLGLDNGLSNKDLAFVILDDTASANLYMNEVNGYTVSVTGDVEFVNDEGWYFNITGDGTITITAA